MALCLEARVMPLPTRTPQYLQCVRISNAVPPHPLPPPPHRARFLQAQRRRTVHGAAATGGDSSNE